MEVRLHMLLLLVSGTLNTVWGNPIHFSPAPVEDTGEDASLMPHSRFTRSCSNAVHSLILGACNKNHKRSPIIMSLIYVEYYVPGGFPEVNSNGIGGVSEPAISMTSEGNLRHLDKTWESSWTNIKNGIFEGLMGVYIERQKADDELNEFARDQLLQRTNVLPRERLKRAPNMAAMLHAVVDKCCSEVGCTELDFSDHCF